MCTSIGISTSGARPLRKHVHYCGKTQAVTHGDTNEIEGLGTAQFRGRSIAPRC
jgi:hypothetical protein